MKKTKLMRAALLLLVLTLITSCFVGGTFAKYTTSATGSDTARVAKWGFKGASTIDLDNLFQSVYYKHEAGTDKETVSSNTNVIAPGTAGVADFDFTYNATDAAPEVAYTFTVSTEGSDCDKSIKDNKNIKWSLDGKPAPATTTADEGSWEALLAAIKNLSGDPSGTKNYEASQLPTEFGTDNKMHHVAWQWVFETADDTNTAENEATAQDKIDTDMGNVAAADLAKVTLKITVSATQID